MKIYVTLSIFFCLQFLQCCIDGKIISTNLFKNTLEGLKPILQEAVTPYQQNMVELPPSGVQPTLYQRKQAEATINSLKNEKAITDLNKQARDIEDTYNQIEQDISGPLQSETVALKQERNTILKRLSVLAKLIRTEYDSLHKDRTNFPIIAIAQNHDDEMRAEVNRIDANGFFKGALDALKGISSRCAGFHKLREAEDKSLEKKSFGNNFDIETETLSQMSISDRINYDREMAEQSEREAREIQKEIKAIEKEQKIINNSAISMPQQH